MRYLLAIAVLLASSSYGETTIGELEEARGTWRVYDGRRYVCSADSEQAMLACAAADAEARRSTERYQLRYPNRYVTVTYSAPAPVCGAKPADLTQTVQCPTGTTGSWPQVKTHITAPYPACWTQSDWTPSEPPEGACVTPPPVGTVNLPVVCSASVAEGSVISACAWASQSFQPANASSLVRACNTASCTVSTAVWRRLGNVTGTVEVCTAPKQAGDSIVGGSCGSTWDAMAYVTPAQVAVVALEWTQCATEGGQCSFTGVRQVRYGAGSTWVDRELTDGTACSNEVFGDPLRGTIKRCELSSAVIAPPPPEEPPPVGVGETALSWQPPTTYTNGQPITDLAGYIIHYGDAPDRLYQSLLVDNPAVTSYVVSGLTPGTHYFALSSRLTNGTLSQTRSNIASKVVR